MRKAQLVELDLALALLLLIGGVLLLKGLYIQPHDTPQLQTTADDAVDLLRAREVQDLGEDYLQELQAKTASAGMDIKPNESIARTIAMLLITAQEPGAQETTLMQAAENLSRTALETIMGPRDHYNVTLLSADRRYTLASSNEPATIATQARTMLSGLQVGKTISGYTAAAHISHASSTRAATYDFGGFVGQGNITATIELPAAPTGLRIEGDFHDNFTISINGNAPCQAISIPQPADPFLAVTSEDLTQDCAHELHAGSNTARIAFTGPENERHYIGGGYLQATYPSDSTYEESPSITRTKHLPGIEGVFNLYDAIYMPGELTSMRIRLHYKANHTKADNTVFFTLGDKTLWKDDSSTTEQYVTIDDEDLHAAGIRYEDYENKTIPYRLGYDNGTMKKLVASVIDAALITDISGSMGWQFDNNYAGVDITDCADQEALQENTTSRISVARCASKDFATLLLAPNEALDEPNRLSLISYATSTHESMPFTQESSEANTTIEGYEPLEGGAANTCICCGIIDATKRFEEDALHQGDPDITRAMLIMTDGVANRHGTCADVLGEDIGDLDGDGTAGGDDDYAIAAACRAKNTINASIYVVGLGREDVMDEDALKAMAACDNITHYHPANTPGALQQIYNDIARDIIRTADYNAQTISFSEVDPQAELYPDSTITYTYKPYPLPGMYGRLLIDGRKKPFGEGDPCDSTGISFPLALEPLEGTVLSYSGNHWTDCLEVNGKKLYDLTDMGEDYQQLGDPFAIGIPPGTMDRGPNTIGLRTADATERPTGCSPANELLYTATIKSAITLQDAYPRAEGCEWSVEGPSGTTTLKLPEDYAGANRCSYTTQSISHDDQDAWQALGNEIFSSLDIDGDGSMDVDIEQEGLKLNLEEQDDIPYLWGPALLEVSVWR